MDVVLDVPGTSTKSSFEAIEYVHLLNLSSVGSNATAGCYVIEQFNHIDSLHKLTSGPSNYEKRVYE